jgi:enoyl-CoA hydratase/carnithine racemase
MLGLYLAAMFASQSTDGSVRTITMSRPDVLNAFDLDALRELRAAVAHAVGAAGIRALVLTGGARAFSTGEDLRAARHLTPAAFQTQIEELQRLATDLRRCPKPIVAAVAGPAFGGGLELALNCDVRIAAESARFACPETKWALTITNGSSVLLRRLVGEGWAREIALLGTEVDSETALRIGLVTRRVADEDLQAAAVALAAQVAELDPAAVAATKRLLDADPGAWEDVLERELDEVVAGFATPAARERLASFRSRRG